MFKKLLHVFFLISGLIAFSQEGNVIIEYKSIIEDNKDLYGVYDYEKTKLITNELESVYYETPLDTVVSINDSEAFSNEGLEYSKTYYKSLKEKYVIYDKNYGINSIIKDEKYNVNWQLTENTKKILGYTCQEATGELRGRKYKAYFTKDIPIQNGPYKFDGLPGLILEVHSLDNAVSIIATKITIGEGIIKNPFTESKYILWDEFLKKYKLYFDKVSNYRGEEGVSMTIAKRYIEVFID